MTKPIKSGEMINNVSVEGDVSDLKTDSPIDGYEYGATLDTPGAPLIDQGIGKSVSIRTFEFKINPEVKQLPTKQELFTHHVRQVSTILWADGLKPVDGFSPRVIVDTDKGIYKFHIVCEPRISQSFVEDALNISQQLLKEHKDETTRH